MATYAAINLAVVRKNVKNIRYIIKDRDYTMCDFEFIVGIDQNTIDDDYFIKKTTSDMNVQLVGSDTQIDVTIEDNETDVEPRPYYYKFNLIMNGIKYTLAKGVFTVSW